MSVITLAYKTRNVNSPLIRSKRKNSSITSKIEWGKFVQSEQSKVLLGDIACSFAAQPPELVELKEQGECRNGRRLFVE